MDELMRRSLLRAALVGAVVSGGWFAAMRGARAELASERALLASERLQIEAGRAAAEATDVDPLAVLETLKSRSAERASLAETSVGQGRVYDRLSSLATVTGVSITRVSPGPSETTEFGEGAWKGEVLARSYSVEATGSYEEAANFLESLGWNMGVSRVDSFTLSLSDEAGQVRLRLVLRVYDLTKAGEVLAGVAGPGGAVGPGASTPKAATPAPETSAGDHPAGRATRRGTP